MDTQESQSTHSSTEVRFRVADSELFFVRASGIADCKVTLAKMTQRSDGGLLEYFTVEGAPIEQILSVAADEPAIDSARVVREDGNEALCEFIISGPCIGETLADAGAVVREVVAVQGTGRVIADVPAHAETAEVIGQVRTRHDAELLARCERARPMPEFTRREFRTRLTNLLTERQLEALRTAYASGYFSWPRESTAEECADALGIAQPTFAQHIRTAQAKLFVELFDTPDQNAEVEVSSVVGP